MAEVTDSELKYFVGVSVKVSGLEGLCYWLLLLSFGCHLARLRRLDGLACWDG